MGSGARADERYALDPQSIALRHIRTGTSSSPGAKEVNGVYFYPDPEGLNGKFGFQSGSYEDKMSEEGSFSLKFSNSAGGDGVLHRQRFACISDGDFRPGDEFIEVWRGKEILFVGVPVSYELSKSSITINGYSPFWLLKKTRETAMGYWASAPRDAMEHYLGVWQMVRGEDFDNAATDYSYSTSDQDTPDGRFTYKRTRGDKTDSCSTLEVTGELQEAYIRGKGIDFASGPASTEHRRCWRFEVEFIFKGVPFVFLDNFKVAVNDTSSSTQLARFYFQKNGFTMDVAQGPTTYYSTAVFKELAVGVRHRVAIEYRDKHVYFFLDGKLLQMLQVKSTVNFTTCKPEVKFENLGTGGARTQAVDIENFVFRRTQRFLSMASKPGDYELPGAPPPGGLEGHYHMDQDILATNESTAVKLAKLLHPSREVDPGNSDAGGLYQRRIDKTINFAGESPPVWQPPGPTNGENFSVRWVGAVYLAMDSYDYAMRLTTNDRGRMWIGKTRLGEEYINDWVEVAHAMTTVTGNWLKAGSAAGSPPSGSAGSLAGQGSGWYPIIIDFNQGSATAGCIVEYTRSDSVGTWAILGASTGSFSSPAADLLLLSPLGVFQNNVQFDSHYDAFRNIADAFGYQWTEIPQSLESGQFPGYVEPVSRIGRNTEYVLDSFEATEVVNQGNADDVADSILAEAQGLGDPSQASQLTLEEFSLPGEGGLYFAQEQESLSDLNLEALVIQRAESLLALHASPWEEIAARPRGTRKLLDSFPLTGALSEFKWKPGDGVRLDFPEILVEDILPRQIQGVTWPFTPDGLGVPNASFKQRPRNMLLTLRKMLKGTIAAQRNYQGQFVKIIGSVGQSGSTAGSDAYSRCSLPVNLDDIARATLSVETKSDASEWQIEVNGVATGTKLTRAGRFDITPWVARDVLNPRTYARLTGGTGVYEIRIELLVRV